MVFRFATPPASEAIASDQPVIDRMLQFARSQHERGQLAEAQRGYRAVLAIEPDNAYAQHLLGVAHFQAGQPELAEPLLARSLSLGLDYAWAYANHGAVLVRLGRHANAFAVLERALQLAPKYAPTLVALGNMWLALQRYEQALDAYDAALAITSALPEAWSNRGNALRAMNRPADALISYEQALAMTPGDYATHLNSAHAWRDLRQLERALHGYRTALVIRPKSPEALLLCAEVLQLQDRPDEALVCYDECLALAPGNIGALYGGCVVLDNQRRYGDLLERCARLLALDPDYAPAWEGRGNALAGLKRQADARIAYDETTSGAVLSTTTHYTEALEAYDRALTLAGPTGELYFSRGGVLQHLGRYDDALDSYNQASTSAVESAHAWYMRGMSLQQLQRHAEAIECYRRAHELDPAHITAHAAETFCHLLTGNFTQGWRLHEDRWRDRSRAQYRRHHQHPAWNGETSVDGKTVLLHAEQGYGDTLQFCRYAKLVAQRGARVILEVPDALKPLMNSLDGPAEVIATGEPVPSFDLQCSLLSLPFAFDTQRETIPCAPKYLQCDENRARFWAAKVEAAARPGTLKIGLAWSGNPTHNNDQHRSVPLEMLAPLYMRNASFFSLHQWVRERDMNALHASGIHHFGSELGDFADTAALVNALDLVICVDTSVVHLAGALGKPCWILLPNVPDWRWMLERDDSPWYPQARLFRQRKPGDWGEVVARIARELATRDV